MKTAKLLSCIVAVLISLGFYAQGQSQVISRVPTGGIGKQIVSIHSFSSQTKNEEGPSNLLIPDHAVNEDKWCDNTTAQPWVIFELSNYYNVDKFVITDAQIREKSNGNIAEYKIYVTNVPYDEVIGGWDDADWVEVVHRTGEGSIITKEVTLDSPQKARYVKLVVLDKGVRADNGNPENAVRLYGFDIYGTFAEKVDRGNLVSVGKTIMKFEDAANKRETPINMLDGNLINNNSKWCFLSYPADVQQRYAVIDLESQYDISQFKIYDASSLESGTPNMQGCNIYVSKYAPDLSKINMLSADANTCWTKVVDSNLEDLNDIKTYDLAVPATGRFVKFEIPYDKAGDPSAASRIFQFQVYGTDAVVAANDATLSLLSVSKGVLSPAFSGDMTDYTVNVAKEVESIVLTASATNKDAIVTGAGEKTLSTGANVFEIKVTSKDASKTQTYKVTINRAEKSMIATLDSLKTSIGSFSSSFNSDSLTYSIDVPNGTESIIISAFTTQANAQVTGAGTKALTAQNNVFPIVVTAEDGVTTRTYTMTVYIAPEGLISVNYGLPTGKRIVNIHSYSSKASDNESPYKLLIGERLNLNGNTGNKWCDNKTDQPWVIFSLTDIYKITRMVIRDGKSIEPTVSNISGYKLEVSTTGVAVDDFTMIDDVMTDGQNVIDINYLADNARYIKLTLYKGLKDDGVTTANAIWLYGVDIYGTKAEEFDKKNIVSLGKTVISCSSYASDRETPCNLVDGNVGYGVEDLQTGEFNQIKSDPWAFNVNNGDAYTIIDLENECKVDSFKVYDDAEWIKGYKVSVNTTGNESDWTEVFNGTFAADSVEYEDANFVTLKKVVGPDPKIAKLTVPVAARFVRLEIPVDMQSAGWNRLREFEVYGGLSTGLNSVKTDTQKLVIYPNPVSQGNSIYVNDGGNLKIYSLQGVVVYERDIIGATNISTSKFPQGSYLIQLSNDKGLKQAKLIIK